MRQHIQRDNWQAEASRVRHDAQRLRSVAITVNDDLAVACLIARARELEALAALLDARARTRLRWFPMGAGRPKG